MPGKVLIDPFATPGEMILPTPEKFLTACEFDQISLDRSLGDELFLALHLIMNGCRNYMDRLKHYHDEQESGLLYRSLRHLSELKMCKLKDYTTVPSPEEIRAIVAECVTVNVTYSQHFIEKVFVVKKKDIPSERDNIAVLQLIKNLPHLARGRHLAKALGDILKMPASAVGACHSFHNSELLMQVAMRQFGIALLIVHEDDTVSDRWPFQTTNYLDHCGSKVFLPITFGLLHVPRDGNLSILRKRCSRTVAGYGKEANYQGYALEMKTDIRTKHVNLLTGLFDLSYTAFADYIVSPKRRTDGNGRGQQRLKGKRDYRDASCRELLVYRKHWDEYQVYLQDRQRAKRAKQADGEQKRHNHGHATRSSSSQAADQQEVRDLMKPEHSISSYRGKTDDEKTANRTWFNDIYLEVWPCLPEPEDMTGHRQTIDQSLRLLGRTIRTRDQCVAFLTDFTRAEIINDCRKWVKKNAKHFHPDNFQRRVTDPGMRKDNDHRFSALTTARDALAEWDELARDKEKREKVERQEVDCQHLISWESEIPIQENRDYMDYKSFRQPKKARGDGS